MEEGLGQNILHFLTKNLSVQSHIFLSSTNLGFFPDLGFYRIGPGSGSVTLYFKSLYFYYKTGL
jgi:hypothetical protein